MKLYKNEFKQIRQAIKTLRRNQKDLKYCIDLLTLHIENPKKRAERIDYITKTYKKTES